jgi:hypothetical protein
MVVAMETNTSRAMVVPSHCLCLFAHRIEARLAFTTSRLKKRCELDYRHQWRAVPNVV